MTPGCALALALGLPDGRTLRSEVDAADAAEGGLLLERLAAPACALGAGASTVVEVDWALVELRADAATVTAGEPDYHADPAAFVASLVLTSRVRAASQCLLRTVGATAAPVGARQFVHVAVEALQAVSVVGVREADDEAPFTGWRIVPAWGVPPADAADGWRCGLHTVQELAALRPAWLAALCLPAGWAFRFAGRVLADAVAPDGTTHRLGLPVEV